MHLRFVPILGWLALAGILAAVAISVAMTPKVVTARPAAIMNTVCELTAVVGPTEGEKANAALAAAEHELRDVEARMSVTIPTSEIGRLNAAPAGEEIALSTHTMEVLKLARQYAIDTGGAFDVTCRPILELWKRSDKAGRLPTEDEIKLALTDVGWDKFRLTERGIVKLRGGAGIDLGGIAKKYAIDLAADAMIAGGVGSGMVNVGGDIRLFGCPAQGGPWRVGIRDPFSNDPKQVIGAVDLTGGAICTSGNYERFVTIAGRQYSHIVDPRTGMPAEAAPSVTVVGDRAICGVWATALSVLGEDGLDLLPADGSVQAMLVVGDRNNNNVVMTEGFRKLLVAPMSGPAKIVTIPDGSKVSK